MKRLTTGWPRTAAVSAVMHFLAVDQDRFARDRAASQAVQGVPSLIGQLCVDDDARKGFVFAIDSPLPEIVASAFELIHPVLCG